MKKIFGVLLFLIVTSCIYKNVYHLEEDDLKWINVYPVGDTVKLNTTKGCDLLCMTKKEVFDKKSHFIENEGQEMLGDSSGHQPWCPRQADRTSEAVPRRRRHARRRAEVPRHEKHFRRRRGAARDLARVPQGCAQVRQGQQTQDRTGPRPDSGRT